MKSHLILLLLLFASTITFAQENILDDFDENKQVVLQDYDLLGGPEYIDQRLIAKSYFSAINGIYDSVRYFFAEADDAFFNIATSYRQSNAELEYYSTDTLSFDSQGRLLTRHFYYWDTNTASFVLQRETIASYNGLDGVRVTQNVNEFSQLVNDKKEIFLRYSFEQLKEYTKYLWNDDTQVWDLSRNDKFDEDGNLVETTTVYNPDNITKWEYVFDADGKELNAKLLLFDSLSLQFVNQKNKHSIWVGDTLTTTYVSNWENDMWVGSSRSVVRQTEDGKLVSRLDQDSVGVGEYVNHWLWDAEFDAAGLRKYYRRYEWDADVVPNDWLLNLEKYYEYDANDHLSYSLASYWVEDSLKVVPKYYYNYEFDENNNMLSYLSYKRDFNVGEWFLRRRLHYYYEDYENGLVSIQNLDKVDIKIFPNPTSDYVKFDLKDYQQTFEVTFYSAEGKLLLSQKTTHNQSVSVKQLSPGMYYYIIKGDGVGASGRFVKE